MTESPFEMTYQIGNRQVTKEEWEGEYGLKPGQWASEGQTITFPMSPPVDPMVEAVMILKEIRDILKGMQS